MSSKLNILRVLLDLSNLAPLYGYSDLGVEARALSRDLQFLISKLKIVCKDPKVDGRLDYILNFLASQKSNKS